MDFGKTADGTPVEQYTLTNGKVTAKVITYGGIVTDLTVPDRDGKPGDVVLGFDTLDGYLKGHPFFGATVGRYANRIAGGKFTLDGKVYTLAVNNGPNSLHGGSKGFDKYVWKVEKSSETSLTLSHSSPDGDEGYPGKLDVTVTFTVTKDDALRIDYTAKTNKATPLNLTNHSYFNLDGPASGAIDDHVLELEADSYTPVDATLIPTGKIAPVRGTPLDFTKPTAIGSRYAELKAEPPGYDHNFVLRGHGELTALAARVVGPKSRRVMEVYTTEPGVQLYTSNFMDGTIKGKGGVTYKQHGAFCLETQHYPDSPNQTEFPTTILKPGQTFKSTTIYKFATK